MVARPGDISLKARESAWLSIKPIADEINDVAPDPALRACFSSSTEANSSANQLMGLRPALRDVPQVQQDDQFNTTELTIFYSGKVHVYEDVSAQKAQALMLLARDQYLVSPTMDAAAATTGTYKTAKSNNTEPTSRSTTSMRALDHSFSSLVLSRQHQPNIVINGTHTELRVARKASLARFLKTRKARCCPKI